MKRISTHTTFLYQLVWPVLFGFFIFVIIKLMFNFQFMIGIGIIYILVYAWIAPIFIKLKNVWMDKDCLVTSDSRGNKNIIQKKDISGISQNASMITPRIVKVTFKSDSAGQQTFRFIPTGGYWMFWQHEIVEELDKWRLKDYKNLN
jgi:hypothetical protein